MKGTEPPNWLGSALLAWFPVLVSLISIPILIFLPNQAHFGYDPSVLWPLLIASLVILALFGLFFRTIGARFRRLPMILFAIGVFILLADILAPVDWGILDGEGALAEPWQLNLIELAIAAVICAVALFLPREPTRRAGVAITVVFAASQIVTLATGIETEPRAETATTETAPGSATGRPNVYHFVFDAYSSLVFEESLDRIGARPKFAGFSFYRNNLSNYIVTSGSTPSYLTGTFYDGGNFVDWGNSARTGGLRGALRDAGYGISLYVPDRSHSWYFEHADATHTSRDISRSYFSAAASFQLAQVSLVRVMPNVLRRETLALTEALFGKIVATLNGVDDLGGVSGVDFYKRLSVPLIDQFLSDEGTRPATGQYVYVHVILPHAPFTWDADCGYSDQSDFTQQTDCATRLMVRVIYRLRELDRLDDAVVLFQSDHGYHGEGSGTPPTEFRASAEVAARIADANRFFPAEGIMNRFHSLFVLKPSAAAGEFRVSLAATQLADIPASIRYLLDIEAVPEGPGRPVTTLDPLADRDISAFVGIYSRDANGKSLIVGRDHPSAELAGFVFNRMQGWRIDSN